MSPATVQDLVFSGQCSWSSYEHFYADSVILWRVVRNLSCVRLCAFFLEQPVETGNKRYNDNAEIKMARYFLSCTLCIYVRCYKIIADFPSLLTPSNAIWILNVSSSSQYSKLMLLSKWLPMPPIQCHCSCWHCGPYKWLHNNKSHHHHRLLDTLFLPAYLQVSFVTLLKFICTFIFRFSTRRICWDSDPLVIKVIKLKQVAWSMRWICIYVLLSFRFSDKCCCSGCRWT